ncbi:MAG: glycosyltransferase family 4 protein [Bacteroidales bacterium]
MKIVNIVPGFGGTFYCGNCLRDSVLVRTLRASGHDSVTLPIYLPLSTSNHGVLQADAPVFYGAVNIYLKQNYKLFRHMPAWLERLLDSKPLLRYAASMAGSTRATGLDEMTLSMLRGSEGFQSEELEQLIHYLKHHEKPDIVHLSNALLLGLAERIKTELKAKVVCSLQDEDVWVDVMKPESAKKVWDLMAEKAKDVDAFIAVSDYFADVMKHKMRIPDFKLRTIHIGVDPGNYQFFEPSLDPPVIGYLSRLCAENGLEILIDAFILLKSDPRFQNARLRLNGGMTGDDRKFVKVQLRKLERKGLLADTEISYHWDPSKLPAFFEGLSAVSVPVLAGEAFGLYQMEALASGIPVVQPALGAFPEIAERTGGGIIYRPNSPKALAEALVSLLTDPEKLKEMSRKGRQAVEDHFNHAQLTEKTCRIYESILV